jgi:predicted transcriptional regulator
VFTGASYEDQMVQMRSATQGMHVRQAMPVRPFLSVAPDYSLTEVLELGQRAGQRDFPVAKDGALVGLLLRDDLLSAFRLEGGHVRVTQIMHHEFPIVSTDDPLLWAQQLMAQSNLSALPVFDHGALIGLISLEDINRAYAYLSWRRR